MRHTPTYYRLREQHERSIRAAARYRRAGNRIRAVQTLGEAARRRLDLRATLGQTRSQSCA